MLRVRGLEFSYGRRRILDGVSFDADGGQIVSILGPNGTGKTTMLKCVCNILRPQAGSVEVGGADVLALKGRELAKSIGFVPQTVPASRMTVFDSVLIGRKPYIELNAGREDLEKTSEVMESLGLSYLSLRFTDEISGGEFQKVQIARAIVQEPSVLVLDEPTNNLDISNQHASLHMVEGIVRSRGICTVMTMHDINLAIHYSDRFLFMKGGKVAAYGAADIITPDLIREVYGVESDVIDHRGVPFVVPKHSSKYTDEIGHVHDVHDHLLAEAKDPPFSDGADQLLRTEAQRIIYFQGIRSADEQEDRHNLRARGRAGRVRRMLRRVRRLGRRPRRRRRGRGARRRRGRPERPGSGEHRVDRDGGQMRAAQVPVDLRQG